MKKNLPGSSFNFAEPPENFQAFDWAGTEGRDEGQIQI